MVKLNSIEITRPFSVSATNATWALATGYTGTVTITGPTGITYTITGTSSNGSVTVSNGTYTYTPNNGFSGTDTIQFNVVDSRGNTGKATATVTVTSQGGGITFSVSATNATWTLLTGFTGTVTVTAASGVTYTVSGVGNNGSVTVNNGIYTYTPNSGFVGTDTINFTVIDNNANACYTTASVTVAYGSPAFSKFGSSSAQYQSNSNFKINNVLNGIWAEVTNQTQGILTVEYWVYLNSLNGTLIAIPDTTGTTQLQVDINNDGSLTVTYGDTIDSNGNPIDGASPQNIAGSVIGTNLWSQFVVAHDGSNLRFWINGIEIFTPTYGGFTNSTTPSLTNLFIGNNANGTNAINGYIDEIRVSNIDRYEGNSPYQFDEYTTDSNTLALYHLNGDTTDDSGNNVIVTTTNITFTQGTGIQPPAPTFSNQVIQSSNSAIFPNNWSYSPITMTMNATGTAIINGWGSGGAGSVSYNGSSSGTGGNGVTGTLTIPYSIGDIFHVYVGMGGQSYGKSGMGGGATYVYKNSTLLMALGAGGGAGGAANGDNASITTSGTAGANGGVAGTNGNGGGTNGTGAGAGGGINSSGQDGSVAGSGGGQNPGGQTTDGNGSYGGGADCDASYSYGSGGGGYSGGGGGGAITVDGNYGDSQGGGGGSYILSGGTLSEGIVQLTGYLKTWNIGLGATGNNPGGDGEVFITF